MEWTEQELEVLHNRAKSDTAFGIYVAIREINPLRTYGAVDRMIRRLRAKSPAFRNPRIEGYEHLRAGYLDIEATNLKANIGYMLSWYIKEKGKNVFHKSVITKNDIFNHSFDKRLILELLETLKNFDIIYTYYGSRYDIPFIKTRMLEMGIPLEPCGTRFQKDLYYTVRNSFAMHSNRLDVATRVAGLQDAKVHKTGFDTRIWRTAAIGDPKSLHYVDVHNKADVILLERLHEKLRPLHKPSVIQSW